jgi:hypothetical protein
MADFHLWDIDRVIPRKTVSAWLGDREDQQDSSTSSLTHPTWPKFVNGG